MVFFTLFFQKIVDIFCRLVFGSIYVFDFDTFALRKISTKQHEIECRNDLARKYEEQRQKTYPDLYPKSVIKESMPEKLLFAIELTEQQVQGLKYMVDRVEKKGKKTPEQFFAWFIYMDIKNQWESSFVPINDASPANLSEH